MGVETGVEFDDKSIHWQIEFAAVAEGTYVAVRQGGKKMSEKERMNE
jgi:hypothetical protein